MQFPKPISPSRPFSLEEGIAVLEAFSEEVGDEGVDLFGDDETLEELASLDDVEVSFMRPHQTPGV